RRRRQHKPEQHHAIQHGILPASPAQHFLSPDHYILPESQQKLASKIAPGEEDMGAIAGPGWTRTFAAAALSLACLSVDCASVVRAEGHRSEPLPAPAPNTLTGDWGGLRTYLERNGITITLNYTNDFLANVRGGIGPGDVGIGIFQP